MTTRSQILALAVAVVAVSLAAPAAPLVASQSPSDPLARFRVNVYEYVGLKSDVIRAAGPNTRPRTFEEFQRATDRIRMALQRARRDVKPGNLFTADAGREFRDLLLYALDDHGINPRELLVDMKFDRLSGAAPVVLNEPFPVNRRFVLIGCIVDALPPLPGGLEYRLDGRDLVIVDADVNLVLDILRDALPR